MTKYYIFNIKNELVSLYKDNQQGLFKILNHIYYMHLEDATYGYNLFNQIIYPTDVKEINKALFLRLHKEMSYTKDGNNHIINNIYKDEISMLKIRNSHLLLESNKTNSIFLSVLSDYQSNYFVCNFKEGDYFFINDIKTLV